MLRSRGLYPPDANKTDSRSGFALVEKIGSSGRVSKTRTRAGTLPLATISLLVFLSAVAGSQQQFVQAQPTNPTFVWYFGYVGNTFYPQSQLGVSPQALISQASSISAAVGR